MRKGKLTQAVLARSVLRVLERRREDIVRYPEYGCGYGAFETGGNDKGTADEKADILSREREHQTRRFTVTTCGSSAGFPENAPESAVREACVQLLAAGAEPVGVTVNLILPETFEEAELKQLMRKLDETAGSYGAGVLGGHTEVTGQADQPLIAVTAVGQTERLSPAPEPDMDLVMIGTIASTAAAKLAQGARAQLSGHFSEAFLQDAAKPEEELTVPRAVKHLQSSGGCAIKAVIRGGIFAALWEMAEHAGIGLDVELKQIPVRQETIEICEFFSLNPYQLFSTDTLLAAVPDGARTVRELAAEHIPAAVIGRTTAGRERILRNGEEVRYLDKPQTDEWYRLQDKKEEV